MRHAKSDWSAGATDDIRRPLSGRGRKDSPAMGAWMKSSGLAPDYIISSPATRARQTIELVCNAAGCNPDIIHWDADLYLADLETLLDITRQSPEPANTVMLVGHNPGLETLLLYLADNDVQTPEDGKILPTATLAQLVAGENWHNLNAGTASLVNLVRPRNLPGNE